MMCVWESWPGALMGLGLGLDSFWLKAEEICGINGVSDELDNELFQEIVMRIIRVATCHLTEGACT